MTAEQHYPVGKVAALTGVSIRTLHHYDGIGLLHPSKRLDSGRRLYLPADLLKLQQILTLRYLEFDLRQIRELLQRTDFDVLARRPRESLGAGFSSALPGPCSNATDERPTDGAPVPAGGRE